MPPSPAVAATTVAVEVVAATAAEETSVDHRRWSATEGRAARAAACCQPTSIGPASRFRTQSRRTTGVEGDGDQCDTDETGPGQRPRPNRWSS